MYHVFCALSGARSVIFKLFVDSEFKVWTTPIPYDIIEALRPVRDRVRTVQQPQHDMQQELPLGQTVAAKRLPYRG